MFKNRDVFRFVRGWKTNGHQRLRKEKNTCMGLKSGSRELHKYEGALGALGALGEGRALLTKAHQEKNPCIVHLTPSQLTSRHHGSAHLRRRICWQQNPRPGAEPPPWIRWAFSTGFPGWTGVVQGNSL